MTYIVQISHAAEVDLQEIRTWYEQIRQGLGDDFLLCINDAIAHIRNFPEMYSLVHKPFRYVIVRRFPYGVMFRLDKNIIKVSGVFHTSRSPRAWQKRILEH